MNFACLANSVNQYFLDVLQHRRKALLEFDNINTEIPFEALQNNMENQITSGIRSYSCHSKKKTHNYNVIFK